MDEIRTGDWRDVARDLKPDTVITDPPFGSRTHEGARTTKDLDARGISYEAWHPRDVYEFVGYWRGVTRRWICALTSHDLIPAWEKAFDDVGWYHFAPVACVIRGMGVRQVGDGPASWTIYLMVGRSSSRTAMANPVSNGTALWRALPGAYIGGQERGGDGRGKPAWLMNAIVRDYSNLGDLVVDPCAGLGSTIRSALALGRRAIGIEVLPDIAEQARASLTRPTQADLFA